MYNEPSKNQISRWLSLSLCYLAPWCLRLKIQGHQDSVDQTFKAENMPLSMLVDDFAKLVSSFSIHLGPSPSKVRGVLMILRDVATVFIICF